MDFDIVKENIQPLRQGRIAERLGIALSVESKEILQKELIQQRKEHELEIQNYKGDDPLELWYEYISWIEQSYPKSGKETHLDDVLIKCISVFEHVEKYQQDRRMIKIYMKYIDNQPNPQNLYEELYNQGIGTMVADLYIGWAYYYDAADNFKKAEEIYQKGLRTRPQPLEDLEHAHKQFGFSMSQRILYKDEPGNQQLFQSSLEERRTALTSLRTHKKRHVGTSRTGLALKSVRPGPLLQENVLGAVGGSNTVVQVFKEEEESNDTASGLLPKNESFVKSLVDNLRTRENTHEPGPWNKAKLGIKTGQLIAEPQQLGFKILEDNFSFTPIPYTIKTYDLGFQRPANFVAKNRVQKNDWDNVPLVIPEPIDPKGIPMYSKPFCYPGNGKEFSEEEYRGYRWFKNKGISNKFTLQYDPIWDDAVECGIRMSPNFAFKNLPQNSSMEYVVPMQEQPEVGFAVDYEALRIVDGATGRLTDMSNEELMAEKWTQNPKKYTHAMDIDTDNLDETVIGERRASIMPRFSMMPGRQSVLPERKSIMSDRKSVILGRTSAMPENDQKTSVAMQRPSIGHSKLEFKTPQVPGISRKSVLPRKSIWPQSLNLSPIKDNSGLSESQNEEALTDIVPSKDLPTSTPFEIFSDEPSDCGSLGAIKKDSLLKRKIDTPDKMVANKNLCTIDTPEKFGTSACPEEPPSNFDAFVVPKLPSPVKQKPFQIFEDDQPTAKTENKGSSFNQNDSMCTMNFNQCIETGSMSTPIKIKEQRTGLVGIFSRKSALDSPSESPNESSQQNISPINPPMDQENADVAQMGYHTMPKQLSTIMETTETTSSTGMHTKSTISSPESDNDTELPVQNTNLKQSGNITEKAGTNQSVFESEESKLVQENTLAPPIGYSIFEDKTENMKAVSLKAPSFNFGDDSKLLPEKSIALMPAFSIFEDKTESMKVMSVQAPSLNLGNDTEIVNKENISRAIFFDDPPVLESLKVSNESMFPAYDSDPNNFPKNISSINKTGTHHSMLLYKDPVQDASVAIKNLSIHSLSQEERPKETSLKKKSFGISEDQSSKGDAKGENSMLAMSVLERSNVQPSEGNLSEGPSPRVSDEFYNSFCKSPVASQSGPKTSIQGHRLDKTQNLSMIAENLKFFDAPQTETCNKFDSVKKLISFEVSKDESQKKPTATCVRESTTHRKTIDFYDLFSKSPDKPGKLINYGSTLQPESKSPEVSSLLKFDTTNTRDTTQALLKLNLDDSKNVSMVAKCKETSIPNKRSLLHESQIKQEKSIHITDSLSTLAKPSFQSPATEIPQTKIKKPLFAEDDNINTMNFASNLGSDQNSTFIAPPEPNARIFGIMKLEGGIRMSQVTERESLLVVKDNTSKESRLSLSMDEDELMKVTDEELVVQRKESEQVSKSIAEKKQNDIKGKISLPASKLCILKEQSKKSFISSEISVKSPVDDLGVSIYVPVQSQSVDLPDENWDEVDEDFELHAVTNQYLTSMIDLDGTRAFIQDQLLEEIINPFDKALKNALLEQVDLINYLRDLPTCSLKNKICQLAKGQTVEFGNKTFDVIKAIGKGAYGIVYTGKCRRTGQVMALKQERPANLWEYYICLEIKSRIANPNILCGYMTVDYSLIGTNASILVSEFSKFGTLIDVCNKIKKVTNRNMDEYIVMHLMNQILDLMDHLHSSQIIHADIKPDNFLVMTKIDVEDLSRPTIQLIDFGVAIDMQLLQNMHPYREVQFKLVADEDPCVEMRENKPWTYQVDLYGVAGTAHAMLFGKYMEVHQKFMKWEIKSKFPRYFQRDIWETFFDKLLNIRSCKEMPNLQELRVLFKEELQNKDKTFKEKINEFNNILLSS